VITIIFEGNSYVDMVMGAHGISIYIVGGCIACVYVYHISQYLLYDRTALCH